MAIAFRPVVDLEVECELGSDGNPYWNYAEPYQSRPTHTGVWARGIITAVYFDYFIVKYPDHIKKWWSWGWPMPIDPRWDDTRAGWIRPRVLGAPVPKVAALITGDVLGGVAHVEVITHLPKGRMQLDPVSSEVAKARLDFGEAAIRRRMLSWPRGLKLNVQIAQTETTRTYTWIWVHDPDAIMF